MATHSSILAWRIPQTEELCGLQYMGSQRVGFVTEWLTLLYLFQNLILWAVCHLHSTTLEGNSLKSTKHYWVFSFWWKPLFSIFFYCSRIIVFFCFFYCSRIIYYREDTLNTHMFHLHIKIILKFTLREVLLPHKLSVSDDPSCIFFLHK